MGGIVSSVGKAVGGLLGGGDAPKAPDYTSAAKATAAGNLEAAKYATVANRANQYTPYGSLTWERGKTDYDPWTQRTSFTPQGQQLFDLQNQQDLAYAQAASKGFEATKGLFENPNIDQSTLPAAPINAGMTAQQAMMSRLQPTLERNEEALRARLANQGIGLGSTAYGREMNLQGQQANDMYLQSAMQGINMDAAARERALNEAYTAQSRPLDLINSLRSGSQVQNPQFSSYAQQGQTQGANLLGAAQSQHNASMDAYNAQVAQGNAAIGGLVGTGLGLAGLPGSGGSMVQGFKGLFA
jgi:hypothetical protein